MAPPPTKPAKAAPVSKVAAASAPPPVKSVKRALPGTSKKPPAKKRKKKDEKSTTTTTTQTANIPVNVYDAVLGEAEDLLAAAMEAQALGRLKMASAYQLLLHARLVGLGKRFDRATTVVDAAATDTTPTISSSATTSPTSTASMESPPPKLVVSKTETPEQKQKDRDSEQHLIKVDAQASVQELAKLIPSNVELDSQMMEHLARAAMELHHQRTGRRIQSDTVQSPPPPKTAPEGATPKKATSGVAWTEQELAKFHQALQKTSDPSALAKAVGTRTEAQVKAYLRNTQERQKGLVEQEWELEGEVSPRKRGGRGRKPPTQAMNTVPNAKLDARSLLSGKPM